MRAPPPVEYPSALTRAWRAMLSLVVGAALASTVAWLLPYVAAHAGSRQPDRLMDTLAHPAILALALGSLLGGAFWLARKGSESERTLRWDGQDWVLLHGATGRPEQRGDVALMLDLGAWMLVRFVPLATESPFSGTGTWLPLTLAGDLARWSALRGALWNWRSQRASLP